MGAKCRSIHATSVMPLAGTHSRLPSAASAEARTCTHRSSSSRSTQVGTGGDDEEDDDDDEEGDEEDGAEVDEVDEADGTTMAAGNQKSRPAGWCWCCRDNDDGRKRER